MEFSLHPALRVRTGTFTAVVAPAEHLVAGLNENPAIQKFLFLFVCGNYSAILPGITRRALNIDVQRAFTAFQLMRIVGEAHHTVIFVEHDPTLYEEEAALADPVGRALRDAAGGAAVVLVSPSSDPAFDRIADRADRIVYAAPPPVPGRFPHAYTARGRMNRPARATSVRQTTLEGY